MRYKFKKEKAPTHNIGDERVVKKFLVLPKLIDDEIRWMENAFIRQKYMELTAFVPESRHHPKYKTWVNVGWVD